MCERERRLTIPPEKFTRPRHTQSAVVGALEKRDERFKTQHPEKGEKKSGLRWSPGLVRRKQRATEKPKRSNFNFTEHTVPHSQAGGGVARGGGFVRGNRLCTATSYYKS